MRNLLYLVIVCIILGCSRDKDYQMLKHAEALMDSHPDSALKILCCIDTASFDSDESNVIYNMLLCRAQERKNTVSLMNKVMDFFIDEDSIIALKENFFREFVQYSGANLLLYQLERNRLSEKAQYEIERRKQMTIYGIIGIVLLVVLSLLVIFNYRQKLKIKEMQLGEKILESASLKEEMEATQSILAQERNQRADIERKFFHDKDNVEEMVKKLFREQSSAIDSILSEYYSKRDIPKLREKIADDLDKVISTIGSADKIAELENIINCYNKGVINKLREQVSPVDERSVKILVLFAAGFTLRSISLITGIITGNLNNLWYRLKKRVAESSALDKELILTLFRRS